MLTSWADNAIKELAENGTATIRPKGQSMKGKVESGEQVSLTTCLPETLQVDDIVLVKVKGKIYLHLIKSIKNHKNKLTFKIGNNRGGINGWVGPNAIYGTATKTGED